ncbi:hypothetical protein MNV49_002354 [Pseudohyphozyma bogoriensis]|nr:hypothetical protein MNV49_002354 [Pseudohyphozyma bogoriensis]
MTTISGSFQPSPIRAPLAPKSINIGTKAPSQRGYRRQEDTNDKINVDHFVKTVTKSVESRYGYVHVGPGGAMPAAPAIKETSRLNRTQTLDENDAGRPSVELNSEEMDKDDVAPLSFTPGETRKRRSTVQIRSAAVNKNRESVASFMSGAPSVYEDALEWWPEDGFFKAPECKVSICLLLPPRIPT